MVRSKNTPGNNNYRRLYSSNSNIIAYLTCLTILFICLATNAQPGTVLTHQKISDTQGGFSGILNDGDHFSIGVTSLGDLDGDGVTDIAVVSDSDDDGGANHGAVWILFLNTDGTVKSHQKISRTQGNFTGIFDDNDGFGCAVANVGDLNGDNINDIAVGALFDDDGGTNRGAVWILFLDTDGTVKSHQKISSTQGNFTGTLDDHDMFGIPACLGDLDGDGINDLAVRAGGDDDGGNKRGALWILFLNSDGTVKSHQKISDTQGNFTGTLDDGDGFGIPANLGDLDGDGVTDIAVGCPVDDDGGTDKGAVWILFLNTDGTVKSHQKISDIQGNFTGTMIDHDYFGSSVSSLGDLDGDGVIELAVGAAGDDDGRAGAVWILFLNTDGTVKSHQKISDTQGNFTGDLDTNDNFGRSVTLLGDLDGDYKIEIAVGARYDDDGGNDRGAVWILSLDHPIIPRNTAIDINPDNCINPFNVASKGALTVAILGSPNLDVSMIDPTSIRLADAPAFRSSYQDVSTAPIDTDDCPSCPTRKPDDYTDLIVKFDTQLIVDQLINQYNDLDKGQTLELTLNAELIDGGLITGSDCIKLVGNVPRHLLARRADINADGQVNLLDFAEMANYWMESSQP